MNSERAVTALGLVLMNDFGLAWVGCVYQTVSEDGWDLF